VDRRTRKQVLGQWAPREDDPRERARGRALQAELAGSPVVGRPVELRRRHFRPSVDSSGASLGGPLPYMLRLREIERRTEEHASELEELWRELAHECEGDPARFGSLWRARAARYDFGEVNDLVERHNRWYPIEARLPMDVRRRDYVLVGGKPYTRDPLDVAWVLERFPAELGAVTRPGV
jgi:hypothetical protein